jgi:hypothetical protein
MDTHTLGKAAGNRGKGRPKGVPNKTTKSVKEAIAYAADKLGGPDRLVAWAQSDEANERLFWGSIYPKLLPLEVRGDPTAPLAVIIQARDADL